MDEPVTSEEVVRFYLLPLSPGHLDLCSLSGPTSRVKAKVVGRVLSHCQSGHAWLWSAFRSDLKSWNAPAAAESPSARSSGAAAAVAEDPAAPLASRWTLCRPPPAACAAAAGHRRGRTNVNLLFVPSPFINSSTTRKCGTHTRSESSACRKFGESSVISTAARVIAGRAQAAGARRGVSPGSFSWIFLGATLSLGR